MLVTAVAKYLAADKTQRVRVTHVGGETVYYKTTSDVTSSSKDGSLTSGQNVTLTATSYFVTSTGTAQVSATAVGPTLRGEPLNIETNTACPGVYAGNWAPVAATSGTDATPAEKKLYLTSVWLPVNKTINGIGYLIGTVGGTNKVIAGLFDSEGKKLANSTEATEGTTVGTAANVQSLALTAAYPALGPGLYYIGITMNGNTARFRAIPPNTAGANIFAGEVTLTAKNVLETPIVVPTTFTGDKGPVGYIY